jgi:hypothetical protein
LCALSAALHVLAIGWLARSAPRPRRAPPQPSPQLSIHLSAMSAPAATPSAQDAPRAGPGASAPPSPPMPLAAARTSAPSTSTAAPAQGSASGADPLVVTTRLGGWDIGADADDAEAMHRPGYQAVQAPPSAVLSYAITHDVPGRPAVPAGTGRLEWHADDSGYRLSLQGVMGELESRGQMNDSGFEPIEARARAGAQTTVAAFDWASSEVKFNGASAGASVTSDGQDRASMLMRLAGMGLAGAMQLNGTVELLVAGAEGVAVVRFARAGEEDIDSPIGKLATVHLVQVTPPGRSRLDVWLAPSRSWYPVQLRVTAPDGSASTQTVTSIASR